MRGEVIGPHAPLKAAARESLPIRTVCTLTGVSAVRLRAWERRYGWIRPPRSAKGHRLYTHDHVELIRRVLALVDRGVPIGQAGPLVASEAQSATPRTHGPYRDYIDGMATAVSRFDERELDRLYDQALSFHPVQHVTRHVLLPLLAEVGERWRALPGGVAEEHFFAMYLRTKLGARLQHRMRYATGIQLLAACLPGERHEIGLMLFALEAHDAGLRTVLLGAETPLSEIAIAQRRTSARAVVLSSTLDPEPSILGRELGKLAGKAGVPVFVGGPTAVRHRAAIASSGAIPCGVDLEDGVRLILATLRDSGSR